MKLGFLHKIIRLLDYFRRHRRYLIWGIVVTILSNAISMISPWIVKVAIDDLKANRATYDDLRLYATLVVIIALMAGLFMFFMRRTIIWGSRLFEYETRNDFFQKLLHLPRSFYMEMPTGDIIARASNDLEAVRMLAGPAVMQILNSFVSMSVALTLMFVLSWKLTLISLAGFPILSLVINRLGMIIFRRFYKIQEHFSKITGFVQENISGIKVVKAYNREQNQIDDFAALNHTYVRLNLALARIRGLTMPSISAIVGLIVLLLVYFGGRQVMAGAISLGTLVAFIFYLMNLIWPMLAVGWVVTLYQRGTASLERIEKIMNRPSEVADTSSMAPLARAQGKIEIKNLSFAYPGDSHTVLRNINLLIPAGSTAAIVGPTGCGKSTLANLLMRAFRVPDGTIFLDDLDINRIPLDSLRRNIGFVAQEPFLFSQTLKENISFGVDLPADEEIKKAAEIAGFREEAEAFPQGFDTLIGERGVTLSGGQKQRATLARAILGNPPVLVLDDAFSAVDTHTEEVILNRLKGVLASRTSLIISHRISTIKNADLIFVMENGAIMAAGTHEELLQKSLSYARMVELQSLEEKLEVLS